MQRLTLGDTTLIFARDFLLILQDNTAEGGEPSAQITYTRTEATINVAVPLARVIQGFEELRRGESVDADSPGR